MKREEIKTFIPEITKEALDSIMAMNGKDIEAAKANTAALTTERDGLRAQLDDAKTTIQSYKDMDIEGIQKAAADWETKYNTDTKALKDQLDAVKYGHAVEKAVGGLKFTSESARKQFMGELTAKQLKLEADGTLLGLEDFTRTYRETDPGAFAPEEDKIPVAVRGTGGGTSDGGLHALRSVMGLADTI